VRISIVSHSLPVDDKGWPQEITPAQEEVALSLTNVWVHPTPEGDQ